MPIEINSINDSDINNFAIENIISLTEIEKNDFSSFYLSNLSQNIENININESNFSDINLELNNVLQIDNFNVNLSNTTINLLENSTVFNYNINIDYCEDYQPPDNGISNPINGYVPPPAPPKIYEYVFSGKNPDTNKFEYWTSLNKDSKRPESSTKNFIHVAIINKSIKI